MEVDSMPCLNFWFSGKKAILLHSIVLRALFQCSSRFFIDSFNPEAVLAPLPKRVPSDTLRMYRSLPSSIWKYQGFFQESPFSLPPACFAMVWAIPMSPYWKLPSAGIDRPSLFICGLISLTLLPWHGIWLWYDDHVILGLYKSKRFKGVCHGQRHI